MAELSGKKFDSEKVDMDLLSPYALEKIASVMTYGKQKYGRDNWRGGIVYSRLLAAVMRHINSYRKGETFDPETGLSHLSHASCGLMMLLEFEETRPDLDDRFLQVKKEVDNVIQIEKKVKFAVGDVVKHVNNDVEVIVEGTYFDVKGNPVLFVKDSDNKIFGVDPNSYKSIYADGAKSESN
jgi:hypothetical protein